MISQMGAYPANAARPYRGTGKRRFRTAARAVLAIQRMNFLVNKSKRVSIVGSRESTSRSRETTSRSRVVNGDINDHTVYHPASTDGHSPRSIAEVAYSAPKSTLYQNGGFTTYTDRYSPRSDRRTYETHENDSRTRPIKPPTTTSSDRFSHHDENFTADEPLSRRSYPSSTSRSPRTYSPTAWSDTRTTSAPRARDPIPSDYTQRLKSPPTRETVSTRRDYSDRGHFDSTPRHSSPRRQELSDPSIRRYADAYDRPLSPSGSSSVGSVHNGSESADHSLNLYIHRLESLQNRLGAINRGNSCFECSHFFIR